MSNTSKVENNGAVNNSQLLIEALDLEGAHGQEKIQQNLKQSTDILDCISQGQGSNGMHRFRKMRRFSTGQLQNPVTSLGNSLKSGIIPPSNTPIPKEFINDTLKSLEQNNREMEEYIQIDAPSFVLHPEAVKATNDIIIKVLKEIQETNFSAGDIEKAIEKAKAKKYNSVEDAQKDQQCERILQKCDSRIHGYARNTMYDETTMNGVCTYIKNNKTYVCYPEIFGNPKSEGKLQNIYELQSSCSENAPNVQQEGSTTQEKCPKIIGYENLQGFDIGAYSSQLEYEYNQFSGDIEIKKLEPGMVLVRDFGQGQSVKGSCWCLAADLNSAVNCDKDLQTRLAVKPSWNGGGNRAVFVVPQEPPPIYVAVGTIAQQENDSDYKNIVYHPGGGTQYNILTPNDCDVNSIKNASGGFANAGEAFDKCCFVIANTGIIEASDRKTVQADQAQISISSSNDDQNN